MRNILPVRSNGEVVEGELNLLLVSVMRDSRKRGELAANDQILASYHNVHELNNTCYNKGPRALISKTDSKELVCQRIIT
jgi:hypothetical protein